MRKATIGLLIATVMFFLSPLLILFAIPLGFLRMFYEIYDLLTYPL